MSAWEARPADSKASGAHTVPPTPCHPRPLAEANTPTSAGDPATALPPGPRRQRRRSMRMRNVRRAQLCQQQPCTSSATMQRSAVWKLQRGRAGEGTAAAARVSHQEPQKPQSCWTCGAQLMTPSSSSARAGPLMTELHQHPPTPQGSARGDRMNVQQMHMAGAHKRHRQELDASLHGRTPHPGQVAHQGCAPVMRNISMKSCASTTAGGMHLTL
jgi:hypothetical protein